jgi:hypothetical protein
MDESKQDVLGIVFDRKNEEQTERKKENHDSWSQPLASSLHPPAQQILHTSGHIADLDSPPLS